MCHFSTALRGIGVAVWLCAMSAAAQVQGNDLGLGGNGPACIARVNEAGTNIASGDGKANYIAVSRSGKLYVASGTGASDLGKAEDSVHTSGDTGIPLWTVRNDGIAALAADGDYQPLATTIRGAALVDVRYDAQGSVPNGFLAQEDGNVSNASAVVRLGAVYQSSASQSSSTAGDASYINNDGDGRLYVNPFGAGAGEFWQACSSAATNTSDTAIKGAVASNRIYVTSISCDNTATVASAIAFKDGATQIYRGGIGNSTLMGVGVYTQTFPTPLRGSVNTALNFAMATTSTSTTCCAAGFISPN